MMVANLPKCKPLVVADEVRPISKNGFFIIKVMFICSSHYMIFMYSYSYRSIDASDNIFVY